PKRHRRIGRRIDRLFHPSQAQERPGANPLVEKLKSNARAEQSVGDRNTDKSIWFSTVSRRAKEFSSRPSAPKARGSACDSCSQCGNNLRRKFMVSDAETIILTDTLLDILKTLRVQASGGP